MAVTDQAENQSNKVPTTQAVHSPRSDAKAHFDTLQRRYRHLKNVVTEEGGGTHFQRQELEAIKWALRQLSAETAAPEMWEALEAALYGMDELIRSYTITHVVRGQCKGQPRLNADEMSAASEAEDQYRQARHKIEAAIGKAKGAL